MKKTPSVTVEMPVLVTTERGVFVGYVAAGTDLTTPIVTIKRGRMVVYWPKETHGVTGLASLGALKGAKISPPAPEITIQNVTMVAIATAEAAASWEKSTWTT